VLGYGVLETGLRLIPFEIAFLIAGPLSGKLSDKYGHMPFTTSGLIVTSISLVMFATVDASTSFFALTIYLILFGLGTGLFASPNMSSIMSCVPPKSRGVASALRATFFNIGFVVSLNLAILVMTLTVPYSLVTRIISSIDVVSISATDRIMFAQALKNTYLWLAVINSLAIIPSILRGKKNGSNSNGSTPADMGNLRLKKLDS
jgi:MFS family permease